MPRNDSNRTRMYGRKNGKVVEQTPYQVKFKVASADPTPPLSGPTDRVTLGGKRFQFTEVASSGERDETVWGRATRKLTQLAESGNIQPKRDYIFP